MEGKVLLAVDGKGKDGRIAGGDGRRTVPLVHIAVQHHHPPGAAFSLHRPSRDDAVVEQAIPLPSIKKGMVGAPAQVDGDAILQRGPAGRDSAAGGVARPLDQFR